MRALFYTLVVLMLRGFLPFNGIIGGTPTQHCALASHSSQPASARSPTALTFFTFPLGKGMADGRSSSSP